MFHCLEEKNRNSGQRNKMVSNTMPELWITLYFFLCLLTGVLHTSLYTWKGMTSQWWMQDDAKINSCCMVKIKYSSWLFLKQHLILPTSICFFYQLYLHVSITKLETKFILKTILLLAFWLILYFCIIILGEFGCVKGGSQKWIATVMRHSSSKLKLVHRLLFWWREDSYTLPQTNKIRTSSLLDPDYRPTQVDGTS